MKVIDEAMDQCLLCIDYAFDQDSPSNREVSLRRLQPGVRQKEWWRYHHAYLGLRTLVGYEGPRPVGHIEFMPIEHAPRPVAGHNLAFINCIYVTPQARGRGVGRGLLEAAERQVRDRADGMAVLARWSGPALPAHFFIESGFQPVGSRQGEALLNKPFRRASSPHFLPVRFLPRAAEDRVPVDFFHCPQCPYSGWVLHKLQREGQLDARDIDLRLYDSGDRQTIELWGVSNSVYIDCRPIGSVPLNLLEIEQGLAQARAARRPA
jgi:GNAT superfamily N-acetyltransferase